MIEPDVLEPPVKPKRTKQRIGDTSRVEELSTVYVEARNIVPNNYNPNRQAAKEFELLIRSIRDDGFTDPIMLHETPNPAGQHPIVDGEHRWTALIVRAVLVERGHLYAKDEDGNLLPLDRDEIIEIRAQRQGHAERMGADCRIPAVLVTMSEEQAKVATLRHNRARGVEDSDKAARVVADLVPEHGAAAIGEALGMEVLDIEVLMDSMAFIEPGEIQEEDLDADYMAKLPEQAKADPHNRLQAARVKQDKVDRVAFEKDIAQTQRLSSLILAGPDAATALAVLGIGNHTAKIVQLCRWAIANGHAERPEGYDG